MCNFFIFVLINSVIHFQIQPHYILFFYLLYMYFFAWLLWVQRAKIYQVPVFACKCLLCLILIWCLEDIVWNNVASVWNTEKMCFSIVIHVKGKFKGLWVPNETQVSKNATRFFDSSIEIFTDTFVGFLPCCALKETLFLVLNFLQENNVYSSREITMYQVSNNKFQ